MRGKKQEKHPYFWLVGAGGPGNYRKRSKHQEQVRKLLIHLKHKCDCEKLPFNLSLDDIRIPKNCPVFGLKFIKGNLRGTKHGGNLRSMTVDRIIPNKGYVKGNVVVVSMKANSIKETSSLKKLEERLEFERAYLDDLRKVVRFYRRITQ